MSATISVMTEESFVISGQKVRSRTGIARHGKSMDVQIAAAVNINPVVCISTMRKKTVTEIKS